MEKENREVKSSVFADLFYEDESAEKNIISLYNALHEEPLPEETAFCALQRSQMRFRTAALRSITAARF